MSIFTSKLNQLFASIKPLGREYYNREVAEGTKDTYGKQIISETYVRRLRNGELDNPSFLVIQTLANFFHVPVSYFFGENTHDASHIAKIAFLEQLNTLHSSDIAFRAEDLSTESIQHISKIIDSFREVEGLPAYDQSEILKRLQNSIDE